MKKNLAILLNIFLVLCFVVFYSGCGSEAGKDKTGVYVTHSFTINKTQITLEVGEDFQLIASYGENVLNFSSDLFLKDFIATTLPVNTFKPKLTFPNAPCPIGLPYK